MLCDHEQACLAPARARRAVRTCLKCGGRFNSAGPHHRFCRVCTIVNSRSQEGALATRSLLLPRES